MQFDLKFLILLCLSVSRCNGGPPDEVPTTTTQSAARYSAQEDDLIIKELSRLAVDNVKIHSKPVWECVADKHREMFNQGAPGFPKERSYGALHTRIKYMVANSKLNKKIPDHLLEKLRQDLNKSPRGARPVYTPAEENFIIEELSKPTWSDDVLAVKSLEKLRTEHDAKRLARTPGFENARTGRGLRGHIVAMEQNGKLPDEVTNKIWKMDKGSSSRGP